MNTYSQPSRLNTVLSVFTEFLPSRTLISPVKYLCGQGLAVTSNGTRTGLHSVDPRNEGMAQMGMPNGCHFGQFERAGHNADTSTTQDGAWPPHNNPQCDRGHNAIEIDRTCWDVEVLDLSSEFHECQVPTIAKPGV